MTQTGGVVCSVCGWWWRWVMSARPGFARLRLIAGKRVNSQGGGPWGNHGFPTL